MDKEDYARLFSERQRKNPRAAERRLIQIMARELPDESLKDSEAFFDSWQEGKEYERGELVTHGGRLYRAAYKHTAREGLPPSAEVTAGAYRLVGQEEYGARGRPVPWVNGMDCLSGKYYTHGGLTYLCRADMTPCVWAPGTPGLWQWELIS